MVFKESERLMGDTRLLCSSDQRETSKMLVCVSKNLLKCTDNGCNYVNMTNFPCSLHKFIVIIQTKHFEFWNSRLNLNTDSLYCYDPADFNLMFSANILASIFKLAWVRQKIQKRQKIDIAIHQFCAKK